MPITSPIFSMFARSPIRPLQKHIDTAHQSAACLLDFFAKVVNRDWQEAETLQLRIAQLESDADDIKRDLRLHLPKGLFMPVARTDILELLSVQDRIANKAQDIAGLVIGRHMELPEAVKENYLELLQASIDASAQAKKAINELDELLETGFRGNEVRIVADMIHTLDSLEQRSDQLQISIRQKLAAVERELPPIEVMFLYKLIQWTGDLADAAQNVGERLEILLAR